MNDRLEAYPTTVFSHFRSHEVQPDELPAWHLPILAELSGKGGSVTWSRQTVERSSRSNVRSWKIFMKIL
jgi:hypothetical protein